MTELRWKGRRLEVEPVERDDDIWLPLETLATAVGGHLQDLPNGLVGLCPTNELCLPLRAEDLIAVDDGRLVRLSALAPLGLTPDAGQNQKQMVLGNLIPDLTFPKLDGGSVSLRSLTGEPAILFCWASW